MPNSIEWSPEAREKSNSLVQKILDGFGYLSAKKFKKSLDELLVLLSDNNEMCPKSLKENLRKCKVSKQTSLIYQIKADTIYLVTFVDNRSGHNY